MKALLVSADLLVQSQLTSLDPGTWQIVGTGEAALSVCGREHIDLVVLDLSLASLDIGECTRQLRTLALPPDRLCAFGPHVHTERLAAARAAGCDEVIHRGGLVQRVRELMDRGG